ncbi:unnamed protein product [Moneuplotes crassus]|uniref:Acyl-coenzyme A oxidase n=1 Tax=Euplotes crassus TaxID=5936 RepID=A0AAD2DA20_EUPCR|nr:unnamed protein product [Moneuplotes crassus]
MWGGQKDYDTLMKAADVLFNDPVDLNTPYRTDFTREETFEYGFKKLRRLVDLGKEKKVPVINNISYPIFTFAIGGLVQSSAHHGMFESVLRNLGDEYQSTELVKKCITYEIFGCYAQTEIAHGSDVRGLQTTATYDHDQKCFIINTPTMKDAKFWPGELGKAANYAVFQAKTIVKGKNVGVQTFVCQIRDMDSHSPLRGVEIGDIGPKYGFASKDNGYMYFDNFKIPKSALLSRYVGITDEGDFIQKGDPRVAYSTMMLIRIQLVEATPAYMHMALLLSSRYCYNRTQFKTLPGSTEERRIIDYQASMAKLAPCLAFSFISKFTAYKVNDMYKRMQEEINTKKEFGLMKALHSVLCALKAYYMEESVYYIKELRELMGGHGYLQVNGITELLESVSPNVTLEGDGCVMHQQTARDIFKNFQKAFMDDGPLLEGYSYLKDSFEYMDKKITGDIKDLSTLMEILKANAFIQAAKVAEKLGKSTEESFDSKWNKTHLSEIVKTSLLHAIYTSAVNCYEGLNLYGFSPKLRGVMEICLRLYITTNIIRYGDAAYLHGTISADQLMQAKDYHSELIENLKPHMTALIECVTPVRNSIPALVSQVDGNMYDKLYENAATSRLNRREGIVSIKEDLVPLSEKLSKLHGVEYMSHSPTASPSAKI